MAESLPTLHHLNDSQSQRILWLMEELKIPYELKLHERYATGPKKARAPDELKQTHVMGKAPQLVTKDGRVIIESSAIASYLISTYDTAKQFQGDPSTGNDQVRDEVLTSFANASLGPVMGIEMMMDVIVRQSPFFIKFLFSALYRKVQETYTAGEFRSMFQYLNDELGDQEYFMGSNPGRADFMISWPLDNCVQRKYVNLSKYPKVSQWYDRIHAREAWKQGLKKGNGYDLNKV